MAMERGLLRLIMRASSSGSLLQRGAALSVREYLSTSPSVKDEKKRATQSWTVMGRFSPTESRESMVVGKRRPVWSRGHADSSVEKDDELPQVNEKYLEFGTHKIIEAKRYAVGRTAINIDVTVQGEQVDKVTIAKEILQQVGEKLQETVEEAKIRQLQEKLAATEGIGEVVHELYNQQEEHAEYFQIGASNVKA